MQETRLVIPLDTIQDTDAAATGAKALSLARMYRIGLSVPAGFCVTAAAYSEHLSNRKIMPKLETALERLAETEAESRGDILSGIRQAIIEPSLSVELREEIESHYSMLGAERVAVRSSATAEDLPGHSFAGLYDTYLGAADLDDCIEAIKKCWASLWTERAYEYRQKNGIDYLKINMAVIVQSLVLADASGVLFTADPVTGRSDQLIIEACFGLGNTLVSSRVTPDRFVLNKRNLKVVSKTISEKKIKSVVDEHGLLKEQILPADRAPTLSIDKSTARKLAKLVRKIEAEFGCPQDIEWAVCSGDIFFLQSRPITTLPAEKTREDRQVWTSLNVGEVVPDVTTPVTWSMVQVLLDHLFEQISGLISINLGDNPLYGLIAGRLYFNINTGIGLFKNFLPRLQHYDYDLNKVFGGEQGRMYELGRLDIQDADIPDLEFSAVKTILKLPVSFYRIVSHNLKRGELFVADMRSKNERLQNLDVVAMSEEKLLAHSAALTTDGIEFARGILYITTGLIAFPCLHKVCSKWLGDKDGAIANKLLAGVGDMDSAEAGHDLWQLAKKADELSDVRPHIVSGSNWRTVRAKLSETQPGNKFLKSWCEFMNEHGHHCRGEVEVFNPRWSETPDYILSLVREYLAGIDKSNPVENHTKRAQQREQLTGHCRQRLKNPVKRVIFDYLLARAQRGAVLRENWKSQGVRYIARFRTILIELGERLYTRGALASPDDIFFLKLEEIEPVTRNRANFNVSKTIASRRAQYEKNKSLTPPPVVVGRFDPDTYVLEPLGDNVEVLNGLAVSPGVVTGKARVILRADTDGRVMAGEILVAPFTDPGWTPYFVPAAGIVMDQGGLLSHGSIIAREYGIPAVVNVGPATRIIKTGQCVQVDGNHGEVRIIR